MHQIVDVHFPDINKLLAERAVNAFYELRKLDDVEKKPATRELINWIRALELNPEFNINELAAKNIPFPGILFKRSDDLKKAKSPGGR